MSDVVTSMPIRTENNADAIIAIADAVTTANTLTINGDGSINAVATATNLDIRDLVFATDKVDASGSTVELGATTLAALESITVQNGSGASAVNIQDGGNSITVDATDLDIRNLSASQDNLAISDGTDTLAINGDGSINSVVTATNLDIRDLTHASDSVKVGDGTDFLAVNADGSINVVSVVTATTPINDFNTGTAVVLNATSNHDYTVTAGKTLHLQNVIGSNSGAMKATVSIETGVATGVFNTVAIKFCTASVPNVDVGFPSPVLVAAGVRVRVARKNLEKDAQDLYSTIQGYEV